MSDDEHDRLVGAVVRRHQAKRKELSCLKERALELYRILVSAAYTLRGDKPSDTFKASDWPTADEISTLLDQIKAVSDEVEELANKRREFGC